LCRRFIFWQMLCKQAIKGQSNSGAKLHGLKCERCLA